MHGKVVVQASQLVLVLYKMSCPVKTAKGNDCKAKVVDGLCIDDISYCKQHWKTLMRTLLPRLQQTKIKACKLILQCAFNCS